MRLSKNLYWVAQIAGWSVYGMLIVLAAFNDDPNYFNKILIFKVSLITVLNVLYTHLMSRICIHFGWLELKSIKLLPRIILISFCCAILISTSSMLLNVAFHSKIHLDVLSFVINILATVLLVFFWNAIYFTYHYFQKSKIQELNNVSLESSKNEIELKNLKSQLNPHFLFNSLNSIRALIDIEPSIAKDSLTTLSNLLRGSLLAGKINLVDLSSEIELVSNYLELEKVRFEERLTVIWDLDETLNSFKIPPFCMQVLVENAIKHGISNRLNGGWITISTRKKENIIFLEVKNIGRLGTIEDTGIGIQNTIRRLDIQFKGRAKLDIKEENEIVIATITFIN